MPTEDTNHNGSIDTYDELKLVLTPFSGLSVPNATYMIRAKRSGYIAPLFVDNTDKTLYPAEPKELTFSTTRNRFTVTGVYDDFDINASDDYFCVKGGKLVHPTAGATVEPFSWVLRVDKRNAGGQKFIDQLKQSSLKIELLGVTENQPEPTITSVTNLIYDLNRQLKTVSIDMIKDAVDELLER